MCKIIRRCDSQEKIDKLKEKVGIQLILTRRKYLHCYLELRIYYREFTFKGLGGFNVCTTIFFYADKSYSCKLITKSSETAFLY